MSKIEIAVDTPEAAQFCAWLISQGHDARVGNSTGTYIDGVLCHRRNDDDGAAGAAMTALWDAYCNSPTDQVTHRRYRIESQSGIVYGDYWGATPEDAFAAMVADAGDGLDADGNSTAGSIDDWLVYPIDYDHLTREQAICAVGVDAVNAVDDESPEQTGRVGYNGAMHGDSHTEWSAHVSAVDAAGNNCVIEAIYYTTNAEDDAIAEAGDGSAIEWTVDHYRVA